LPALTARDAYRLAANSFEASFADAPHKAQWLQQLDAAFAAAATP
jgi:adenine deaminase